MPRLNDVTSVKWVRHGVFASVLAGSFVAAFPVASAWAQDDQGTPASGAAKPNPADSAAAPSGADKTPSIWERDKLLGDLSGVRTQLDKLGIQLNAIETSEVLGNVSGGIKQGATYEGALQVILTVDTSKLVGWQGGKFNASGFDIRGRGLSANNVNNWNVLSNIEAPDGVRLFELWYEQSLFNDKASVRIGQLAADQEFLIDQYATFFINSAFGWPTLPATVLPGGGPAYPRATPGIRFKGQPTDEITVLAALFNGDPDDNGTDTSFRVNKGAFAMAELQYAVNGGDHPVGLPGTYKVGAWYNSNTFLDQHYGTDGLSLADPASNGMPIPHRGDWSLYAAADQLIYKVPGTKDQGLAVFARIMGSPDDRNVIDFFIDAGVTYKGLIPGRPDDTAGAAVIYAKASDATSQLDQNTRFFTGTPSYPIRDAETVIETTYQIQLAPWWALQPDFQYVIHPQGSIPNPLMPTQTIPDAAVFGLRTTIIF
ncbi:MAG: carbohydrate porin [Methylovirgula sp.]